MKIGKYQILFACSTAFTQSTKPVLARHFLCLWLLKEASSTDIDNKKQFPLGTPMTEDGVLYHYARIEKQRSQIKVGNRGITDPWITTFSGRQFFLMEATKDDIYIEDIAHGLSNICRYTGQCKTFYSVAEHSVRLAELSWSPSMKLHALLHDAPEAYLNDLSTPVKQLMPEYRKMEEYLLKLIFDKYGISKLATLDKYADSTNIKSLDVLIRTPEVLSLFTAHPGWELPDYDYGKIKPWSHKKAERKFLRLFKQLYKEVHNGNSEA